MRDVYHKPLVLLTNNNYDDLIRGLVNKIRIILSELKFEVNTISDRIFSDFAQF